MANVLYSNARAKALTNNLLGLERLKRMIDSTPIDALRILSEVNFGEGVNISNPLDFEKILYAEEKKLLSFIRSTSPSESFKDYFLIPYDYHNADAFIKAKFLKIDAEKMLVCHGNVEAGLMGERIFNDDYRFFSPYLSSAISECDKIFVMWHEAGEIIGRTIKKALYNELYSISKSDKLLKEIFTFKVDMTNVSTALRYRDFDLAKDSFLLGGKVSLNDFKLLCTESIENINEKIKFLPYGEIISLAVDSLNKGLPFSAFENQVNSFTIKLLKKMKYETGGYIPFALYCYYKLNEIQNVRIIMVGLNNGLDKSEILGRLLETYEG